MRVIVSQFNWRISKICCTPFCKLRLEALHQILVLLSGMEEKLQHLSDRKQIELRFPVIHSAHICEAAVSSRVFWFRHCWTCRSQRREWPIASLSGRWQSCPVRMTPYLYFYSSLIMLNFLVLRIEGLKIQRPKWLNDIIGFISWVMKSSVAAIRINQ